ncbi:MAG: bifunctional class I SAM-dependent methyltransferase/glycosyltransferase family 2 protein [Cyanobacteria bacterium J06598_3]
MPAKTKTKTTPHPHETHKQAILSHFNRVAPESEKWHALNHYYYSDLAQLHQFLIPAGSRVLDIGCGLGDLLNATRPSVGIGVDLSLTTINLAQRNHPHLRFYCADAETLTPENIGYAEDGPIEGPLDEPQTFDYIICANAASYFSDIQTAFTRLKPFCTPQTRLIISFHNYLWEPLLKLGEVIEQRRPQPPQNWLSMDDVTNLLSITGYIPLKRGRRFLCPRKIPGVAYGINRFLAPLPGIKHLGLTNYVVARPDFRTPRPTPHARRLSVAEVPSVSVIIPARNESGNIADAVARMPEMGSHTEIIFVEGHSSDETWDTVKKVVRKYKRRADCPFTFKSFQQKGKGKADAVRLGFAEATGDILMILDADLTVPPEDLPHFFDAIASGQGEFINGSRLLYPRSKKAMPWLNTLANKTFALMFSFLLDQPLKDTLCGTKVLWRKDYERIAAGRSYFGDFDPFGDFDLLFGAAKLNLHLVEVPIRYQSRTYGSSNIAHVKEGLVLLKMCAYAAGKLKFI